MMPGMSFDDALIGHWSSAPFDYGVMEGSDLGFLPDGRGWGVWANLAGIQVTRFRWHCPTPGLLEVREVWAARGDWGPDGEGFASVAEQGACEAVTRTGYSFGPEETLPGQPAVSAVRFTELLEGTEVYGRGAREIRPGQDPSYKLLPYS